MIGQITIITTAGAKSYRVGDMIDGERVDKIAQGELYFQGDPFDHYIGRADSGTMLFSINCLVPCVIEYEAGI